MFESFYNFEKTPFSRDIPTEELYPSFILEETLGRLNYAAERQLFAVIAVLEKPPRLESLKIYWIQEGSRLCIWQTRS